MLFGGRSSSAAAELLEEEVDQVAGRFCGFFGLFLVDVVPLALAIVMVADDDEPWSSPLVSCFCCSIVVKRVSQEESRAKIC